MKKVVILCLLCILVCGFCFTGCFSGPDVAAESLSEVVENILKGENENFSVEITYGKQEIPYVSDGICGNVSKVVNISIIPKNSFENFEYRFESDGGKSNGVLISSLLKDSYVVTVKNIAITSPSSVKLFVKAGSLGESEIPLTSTISDSMMTAMEAFTLARAEMKEQFDALVSDKKFMGEICVRLINESSLGGDAYYWYVVVVKKDGSNISTLIDPTTREIKVKKIM